LNGTLERKIDEDIKNQLGTQEIFEGTKWYDSTSQENHQWTKNGMSFDKLIGW